MFTIEDLTSINYHLYILAILDEWSTKFILSRILEAIVLTNPHALVAQSWVDGSLVAEVALIVFFSHDGEIYIFPRYSLALFRTFKISHLAASVLHTAFSLSCGLVFSALCIDQSSFLSNR